MAPRFDETNLRIELAVADLLEPQLARSIGFANRGGFERMWLGQAIHGRYQEDALAGDGTYRREVALRHEFVHRGWTVTLTGRADGIRKVLAGQSPQPGARAATGALELADYDALFARRRIRHGIRQDADDAGPLPLYRRMLVTACDE